MCPKQGCQDCTGTQIQIYSSKKHRCQGCQTCTEGYLQWYVFKTALPRLRWSPKPGTIKVKPPLTTMPHLQQIVPTVMCVRNSNENHALETKCSYIHTIVKFARSALKGTYSDMCSKQYCQHCTGTQIQIYSSKKHRCQRCQTCTVGYLQ